MGKERSFSRQGSVISVGRSVGELVLPPLLVYIP